MILRPGPPVVVLLRRSPAHPRTAQGLRAAVGYLSAGLQVQVVLCGPARALAQEVPAALSRPIATLRALGQPICTEEEADLCALLPRARAVVAW
jgi:hypothetical protein